ncbi:hypothetical protein EVJ58_g10892 [Rhodofomes roseus]|uniref:Uncharacterized protein n=1 Tax=Rhodofomes roseus TaxID=34475 RepID=A0A4Y9XN48_9APHY|nr:hypothetical protein EVJ58_g10892 [Rhodofomes roseus]
MPVPTAPVLPAPLPHANLPAPPTAALNGALALPVPLGVAPRGPPRGDPTYLHPVPHGPPSPRIVPYPQRLQDGQEYTDEPPFRRIRRENNRDRDRRRDRSRRDGQAQTTESPQASSSAQPNTIPGPAIRLTSVLFGAMAWSGNNVCEQFLAVTEATRARIGMTTAVIMTTELHADMRYVHVVFRTKEDADRFVTAWNSTVQQPNYPMVRASVLHVPSAAETIRVASNDLS